MKRHNIFKVVAFGLLCMLLMLTGCGDVVSGSVHPVSQVTISGSHKNAWEIPADAPSIHAEIYSACISYGDVTIINVDGDPKVAFQLDIPRPTVEGLSADKLKRIAEEYAAQIQAALSEVRAEEPEVDTLKAIWKAAQALKNSEEGTEKHLLILDSGLSTTGYMDFTTGLLSAEPEAIVEALEGFGAIPDLEGVIVTWAFCGEVASPQQDLNPRQKEQLKSIWEQILLKGGAASVTFSNAFTSNQMVVGAPDVSIVELGQDVLRVEITGDNGVTIEIPVEDSEDSEASEDPGTLDPPGLLDRESVDFIGNQDVFVDEQKARECIRQAAEEIKSNDREVLIIGTTASGRPAFTQELSEKRAAAVVRILEEYGVDPARMTAIGLGCTDPWHVDDRDENGKLDYRAAQNRKVLIVDINSDEAALVLNK